MFAISGFLCFTGCLAEDAGFVYSCGDGFPMLFPSSSGKDIRNHKSTVTAAYFHYIGLVCLLRLLLTEKQILPLPKCFLGCTSLGTFPVDLAEWGALEISRCFMKNLGL